MSSSDVGGRYEYEDLYIYLLIGLIKKDKKKRKEKGRFNWVVESVEIWDLSLFYSHSYSYSLFSILWGRIEKGKMCTELGNGEIIWIGHIVEFESKESQVLWEIRDWNSAYSSLEKVIENL